MSICLKNHKAITEYKLVEGPDFVKVVTKPMCFGSSPNKTITHGTYKKTFHF